ncbi:lipase family protein [Nocardia brasiliensis]|uniref:Secretory lipase n=1 Tax=Nocardia brasiliensis (strain ATCC 700358 / HUJEG-1) TaxID=1133849 RepID=K0EKM5_NOCB7|nr:lipase family protein [Nocardia brasiliensis]AFT99977.1 secretory lipase [Nocardia brasiliensis ATCC 700358]OCF85001.1 lipase [Nocardia brasiliensis]
MFCRINTALTAAVLLVAATQLAALPGTAAAQPLYPLPDPDPFYAAPADLDRAEPGDVLDTRPMPGLLAFPGTTVTMIKFRSTDSAGAPIAATTTVLTPANHVPGGPLLSYQHIINGLGTQCAVSRVLYTGDPNLAVREAPALNTVLLRGWSVALPDHLGPTSAYGAARLGGMITLDGIRAARKVARLGVATSPVAMFGYSGGGMATGWAAALAPTYAPELDIVGAAEGGVPMNLVKMTEGLGYHPHPAFGLAMAAAIGLEREYPTRLPISDSLNPTGLAIRDRMANGCTNEILAAGAGHSVLDVAFSTSLAEDPSARGVLEENSLELYEGVPKMPIYQWRSHDDALIPVAAIDNTMRRYCAAGVRVQSKLFPSPDHLSTAVLGAPEAMGWIEARFRGETAPRNC